jgi:hypothetical protein
MPGDHSRGLDDDQTGRTASRAKLRKARPTEGGRLWSIWASGRTVARPRAGGAESGSPAGVWCAFGTHWKGLGVAPPRGRTSGEEAAGGCASPTFSVRSGSTRGTVASVDGSTGDLKAARQQFSRNRTCTPHRTSTHPNSHLVRPHARISSAHQRPRTENSSRPFRPTIS